MKNKAAIKCFNGSRAIFPGVVPGNVNLAFISENLYFARIYKDPLYLANVDGDRSRKTFAGKWGPELELWILCGHILVSPVL